MSFDGEYKTNRPEFESIEKTWEYSNDLGSTWFFYPFHFVTSKSGKTIKDAPEPFTHLVGSRTKTLAGCFERFCNTEEAQEMGVEQFAYAVPLTKP